MKTKRLVVDIPASLHKKFAAHCKANGLIKKDTVTNIISKYLIEGESFPNYFLKLKEQDKKGDTLQ